MAPKKVLPGKHLMVFIPLDFREIIAEVQQILLLGLSKKIPARLYESMKLELDVKSEKVNVLQNRRKSGSRSHCTTEKESAGGLEGESPISLVSLKSRLKSSRSPQIKGEQGSSQTGEQRSVEETVQAPKDTRSPGILRTEMVVTKTTTPLRYSQQNSSRRCQSEDLGAVSRRESVSLDQSEGFGAEHKMFTPQKFLPRNQTPIKVENAGSFGNTPEKFSKKRKSIPTSVDNLPTETEMVQQTVPAPLVLQAEGKIQNGFLNKTAGQMCPGAPGPDAADAGSFGDSINKVEGVSLKRRRVSFGGRLRPELFDENLPPNTPLKRGETPKQRRSLVAHTPAVLKKIIKKPTGITDHQFSTGHANSPCTIIIGKAHIERVNGPARPYTMLNSFVFNKPADFSEDLSETEFKEDSVDIPSVPQTPARAEEPTDAENRTTKLHWKSPQPDRISSPARTNTQPKTPSRKGDVEEVSALGKPTQTPGDATHTDRGPGDDENINLCKETPKQKQNPAENVTGSKRRPRTPKEKARSLEDLIGFKELFQTPHLVKEPMIDDKTPQIPCKSPRPEPVVTSTSMTRPFKTLSLKAEVQEDLSALRKPTQTPGDTTHSHGGPAGADKDIQMFNETSRQKLDFAESVTGIKRRPRTPKEKVQSLEDLAGFKELFQTPVCTKEPTAVVKTPQMLWISPQPKPNVTPTNRKRQLKTPPQKVDREVELSAPRKSTQTPGETRHSDSELVGDDEHRAFKENPKQKLDSAENVTGSKKRSRTPKTKAPPLEDLIGFKELFQTPHHVKQPMTDDKTPQIPCKSPRLEPVDTPASRKGQLKTAPQKVDREGRNWTL
ncbi:Proliferation marker protein Ki-67 [Camelus dromedarius]|uniref:Proliferation marker protein Ki-67 n=1 Tax=Camelus dromedarius TaxID=9838 RepID=A0A5N4DKQ3_CAMDR|nr:Proliferation marker protein Ki-67 [Camelus dromedarius]